MSSHLGLAVAEVCLLFILQTDFAEVVIKLVQLGPQNLRGFVEEHLEELGLLQTLFVGVGGVSYLLGDELLFLMVVADVLRK